MKSIKALHIHYGIWECAQNERHTYLPPQSAHTSTYIRLDSLSASRKYAIVLIIMESPCEDNAEHQNAVAISTLECPVCFDVSKGAIFKCENGHIICLRCLRKLAHKKCPTCRQEYATK